MNTTKEQDKKNSSELVGAVMVVGGGIGGMQAALDLANSGYKVYMIEATTAIGGRMAQLDKTFPTNDCSMCTISPKLIEVDKHLNIDIITHSEIEKLEGKAGNFRVTVLKRPRFIIEDKCNACGDCLEVCPVELTSEFDEDLMPRKAVYKRYPQAIPNAMAISKADRAPCNLTCPTGINIQGYVALVSAGKFQEAYDLIRERNPFPSVCGRVCHHPCEGKCNRAELDEPVAINPLKRFVSDYVREKRQKGEVPEEGTKTSIDTRKPRVAIIGSGPSGLTAAQDLALMGYPPTVFEALPVVGGMMKVGIPDYRLPSSILEYDINLIKDMGVEIRTNTPVGSGGLTLKGLFDEGYKAVFLAIGAHRGLKLNVEGEDLDGVFDGATFLRKINLGEKVKLGKKVVVVGGGNVAIDAARTLLRLGAEEVRIIYRRTRAEMPAIEEEVEDADHEGIKIQYLVAPARINGKDGRVSSIECIRMELGEPDESGRRRPIPVKGSEFSMDADMVVSAIGQAPEVQAVDTDGQLKLRKGQTIEVDPITLQTGIEGVFAGGDAVTGPASVVEAINYGHEAAVSIDRYLTGVDLKEGRDIAKPEPAGVPTERTFKKMARQVPPRVPFEQVKGTFKEIRLPFTEDQAVREAKRCMNCGLCCECLQCVTACGDRGAVDHCMKEERIELNVGSVILVPGYESFDAKLKGEYGYGRMPNVITSLEFERILSASGPYQGHILRPSDRKEPKRVAWIQCVGSRDVTCNKDYCSSVCCMYATKEAIMAVDHVPGLEATIFYNDIRAFGKGFENYYESAKKNYGVRYVNGIPSSVKELQKTKNLKLRRMDESGEVKEEEFDLIVLSTGLSATEETRKLAERVGIDLNRFGFCETGDFTPNRTSRPGIFVAGAYEAPMDIPETVMGASCAAALSSELLARKRGTLVTEKQFPPEMDVTGEEPRIGVFVCRCGTNIARVVGVSDVVEYAKKLPNVVYAEENLYTCSTDTQQAIIDAIKNHNLNRVVVASCTPRTHEPLFQETIREAGLNKYLFEMANIRDQCSWVHATHPEKATEKSKDLVRMSVAKARALEPIKEKTSEVIQKGLVIGGGLSGMVAALSLADQGFDTCLVEREPELGGLARKLHYTLGGSDVQKELKELIEQVEANPRIQIFKGAEVREFSGHVGNFTATISANGSTQEINHGAVVIATGGSEYEPTEYLYGKNSGVLTQIELEERIAGGEIKGGPLKSVVMIQCVGSREEGNMYCCRVGCTEAIKNALKLKAIDPDVEVAVLYRDIRTYAFSEIHYREAREKGVLFLRYDEDKKPEVYEEGGGLKIKIFDETFGKDIVLEPDCLVLTSSIRPHPLSEELSTRLKASLNPEGFYLEAHMKLRPLDFANDGMYLCGLAHNPKLMGECISQAKGAAARAATILSKKELTISGIISVVDQDHCAACLTCVRECPFDVPVITEDGVAYIEPASCQGCGMCASVCPRKAIEVQHYKDDQIVAKCLTVMDESA